MKPNIAGIWEWFEQDGTKRLMLVCNVMPSVKEQWLRAYWWGGYYDIEDSEEGPAEWPDRWGEYVGPIGCRKDEELYLMPTPEQRAKIFKEYHEEKK